MLGKDNKIESDKVNGRDDCYNHFFGTAVILFFLNIFFHEINEPFDTIYFW